MKQELISCMDQEERNAVEILQNFGIKRNVAKVTIFFLSNEKATSTEIEKTMNMRQPEVSLSMRPLVNEDLIDPVKKPTSTKGRPKIVYTRTCPSCDFYEFFLSRAEERIRYLQQQQHKLQLLMGKLS